MRYCKDCNSNKSETEFYKNKARKDGLSNLCKVCFDARALKYRRSAKGRQMLKRSMEKHDYKQKARAAVSKAIKMGKLDKGSCFCGDEQSYAHHPDYNHPLKVVWLCARHHTDEHMRLRRNYAQD